MENHSQQLRLFETKDLRLSAHYSPSNHVTLFEGDTLEFLRTLPPDCAHLVVTSPPYNIGKSYERRTRLEDYLSEQEAVISECVRILHPKGSICWQVGNHVTKDGEIIPLDVPFYPLFKEHGLRLRNRIIWHFEHGLHCRRRLSGRYEVILWFTKGDDYQFDLDPIRVPQKYPAKKYFKGPRAGQYSCNPLGKNPGDLWAIPNVKHNHPEKTVHPCQFPVELVERLVLSMTHEDQLVVDPFIGVGTTAVAAIRRGRRAAGADISPEYIAIARERIRRAARGDLPVREMGKPIYQPRRNRRLADRPLNVGSEASRNGELFRVGEAAADYGLQQTEADTRTRAGRDRSK